MFDLKLTNHEIHLLKKLLFTEHFQPDIKERIARFLDGTHATTATRDFVDKLIGLSCLTFVEVRRVKVGSRLEERPVYDRDRVRIKNVYKQTDYFKLAYDILDEDEQVI